MQELFIHLKIMCKNVPVIHYQSFDYDMQTNILSSFYAFEYEFTVVYVKYEVCVCMAVLPLQCKLFIYMKPLSR